MELLVAKLEMLLNLRETDEVGGTFELELRCDCRGV